MTSSTSPSIFGGEVVDAVRKQEHRKLSLADTSPYAGGKWV